MKILAIVLLLTVIGQFAYAKSARELKGDIVRKHVQRIFGDRIQSALENFKEIMKTGNETLGVPKLDPFDSEYQKINVDEQLFVAEGLLADTHIEGLSDFAILDANYEIFTSNVVIDLVWSNIKGYTQYNLSAIVTDQYPIYGQGDVSVELQNFNFGTKINVFVDLIVRKIYVIGFSSTKILSEQLKLEITGLYDNPEISREISTAVNELAVQFLVDFQDLITSQLNVIMVPLANKLLEKFDVWELINI